MSSLTVRLAPVLLVLCAGPAGAQPFGTTYASLQAQNPKDGIFHLKLTAAGPFHEGELLPVEVEFHGPPQSRYTFAGVLIDGAAGCGDLARPCQTLDMHTFSKMDPILSFGYTQRTVNMELNGYVPRLKAGHYQAALLARLLVRKGTDPITSPWVFAEPARYVVSERIHFEVIPATELWIRSTVSESAVVLEETAVNGPQGYERRVRAARRLRYLQHPLAWEASLAHYGQEPGSNDLMFGLSETTQPAEVCALMRSRVGDRAQFVSFHYLNNLADICMRARPDFDPSRWDAQVRSARAAILGEAAGNLAASLRPREGVGKGAAILCLLEYVQSLQNNSEARAALPAWMPELRKVAADSYFQVPFYMRGSMIGGGYWHLLRGPEMMPVIRAILEARVVDYNDQQNWNQALRRLYEVDPAEGRNRLLAELRNPETRIDEGTLALLPPDSVSGMDNELIDTLAEAQRRPAGNARMAMLMIARYASPRALPRLRAIYESQQNPCQPELMAYFLRTDPGYADAVFHRHPWDMQAAAPCAWEYFSFTPKLRMHAVLEKYLTAYLMHGDVRLKMAAAESLGKYGSPTAQGALWEAFRYFHNFWKDRRGEVGETPANEMLESALRTAIARGRNWIVGEADLRMMESLCITQRCTWETREDLQASKPPLRVNLWGDAEDVHASVAQYSGLTLEELKRKLAQFPKGTPFELDYRGRHSTWRTPDFPNAP